MYYLRRSPRHHDVAQLVSPSFAYMLANPPKMRCSPNPPRHCATTEKTTSSNSSKNYIHVVEETDQFHLFTDLPGVKAEDLKVELTDNSLLRIHGERKDKNKESRMFDRQFMLDDQLVDISTITANLTDGTLQITAPKKEEAKPRRVAVVASPSPNAEEADEAFLSFEVEVPGVKVNAIQVQVESTGKLVVVGERKRAGETETIHRAFSLNKRIVNTDKLEAFLQDGVLTLRAPKNEPVVGRVIPVTTSNSTEEEDTKNKVDEHKNEATKEEQEAPSNDEENQTTEEEKSLDTSTDSSELEYEVVPETVTEENE